LATIKDIAKKAGVSISTVSYILNNTKSVKQSTKERVLKAAATLHYRPNLIARSLKTKESLTIGIIIPDISNMFFNEIIRGIEDVADAHRYNVVICSTDENKEKEERHLATLVNKGIDGLIFIGTGHNLESLHDVSIPKVIVDRRLGDEYYSVLTDNITGGYIATTHLLKKREQQDSPVLFLTGPLTISSYKERYKGYKKALKDHNITFKREFVYQCEVNTEGGKGGASKILQNENIPSGKPFGIFAANDLIAIGAINVLIEKGVKIPEDVQVVGFDDIPSASYVSPSLTTVNQPKYDMGKIAGELLLKQIRGEEIPKRETMLESVLVVRESSL